MKFLKLFEEYKVPNCNVNESFNKLSPEIQEYYEVVKLLPEYFKNLKIVNLTDSDDGMGIEFSAIETVKAEENEYHAGENWEFTLSIYDGQIEMSVNNSGHDEEINSIDEFLNMCISNFPDINIMDKVWKILIEKDSKYKLECPAKILKKLGYVNLGKAKEIGVFENLADTLDVRMIPYYNVVKWCNYFQDIIITVKNGHSAIIFKNDRNGRNEIGISKANLLFCQFGEFSDRIELDSLEQFVDFCGQDLAAKDLFNLDPKAYTDYIQRRNAENEMFDARRQAYILNIWSIALQHDISYKIFCPVEILNKLGFSKIANVKRIGVLDESLTENEIKKDMTFYVKALNRNWKVGEIWHGIEELIAYVEKEKLKDDFDWSLYRAICEDNFQELHYKYMVKHKEKYADKTILFVYDNEQSDDEENWCFVVYGYDKQINVSMLCEPDHVFEIDDSNRWQTSDDLKNTNNKTGILE